MPGRNIIVLDRPPNPILRLMPGMDTRPNMVPASAAAWEQGLWSNTDGTAVADTARIRTTSSIAVAPETSYSYSLNATYTFRSICYYDAVGTFISGLNIPSNPSTLTTPVGCYQVKISVKRVDLAAFTTSQVPAMTPLMILGAWPQSLADRARGLYPAQNGSTASSDINDGAFNGTGWVPGSDDYLKLAQSIFDDMARFTVIAAIKAPSASAGRRIFDKGAKRYFMLDSANKLEFIQFRASSFDEWKGNTAMSAGSNYIASMRYDATSPDSGPIMQVGATVQTNERVTTGTGALTSDAAYDLIIANNEAATKSLGSDMYEFCVWDKILSKSQEAYWRNRITRDLYNDLGVVI